jgi:hypothetical protein
MKTWQKYFELEEKMKSVAIKVLSGIYGKQLSQNCSLIKEYSPLDVKDFGIDPEECCLFKLIDESFTLVDYVDQDWFDMTDKKLDEVIRTKRIKIVEEEIETVKWERERQVSALEEELAKLQADQRGLTSDA